MIKKWTPRVEKGITKLWVSHEGKNIAFAYPEVWQFEETHDKVGAEILHRNQLVPTGDYTASLVHAAYCIPEVKKEPEFSEGAYNVLRSGLLVFNTNLWTDRGVYVIQDLKSLGLNERLDQDKLEEILKEGKELGGIRFSKDGKVRFAPRESYKIQSPEPGEFNKKKYAHTPNSLVNDGFIIASFGIDGAIKLGEVSSKCLDGVSYIYGEEIKKGKQPVQTVSKLSGHHRYFLQIISNINSDRFKGHLGRAFGILREEIKPKLYNL